MNGRKECGTLLCLMVARAVSLENDSMVAHRATHETLLPCECRRGALAHDDDLPSVVDLLPCEIVVVMHLEHRLGTEDLQHLRHHAVAARIGIGPSQAHEGPVVLTLSGRER